MAKAVSTVMKIGESDDRRLRYRPSLGMLMARLGEWSADAVIGGWMTVPAPCSWAATATAPSRCGARNGGQVNGGRSVRPADDADRRRFLGCETEQVESAERGDKNANWAAAPSSRVIGRLSNGRKSVSAPTP